MVHAACPHDCPDACGVLITVEDGRATRIQGDPAHPVTRGFLCAKVAKYLDRVYSPDRVLYPMKRVRPKGSSTGGAPSAMSAERAFERISWDEALDQIASRLHGIASNSAVNRFCLTPTADFGRAQRRIDGSPLLSPPRSLAAGPQHLLGRR